MKNKTTLKIVNGGVLELWVDKIEKEFINILDNSDHVQNWLKTVDQETLKSAVTNHFAVTGHPDLGRSIELFIFHER